MKKKWVASIILILIAGAAGIWWKTHPRNPKNGMATRQVQAHEGPIEDAVEATGEVSPLNRVEIKPPIQGRIEKILVEEGSRVKQGEILAWMSSSDRAAILDAARSQGPEAVKRWEDTYKPTPIVAPLNGIIILRNIVVGQTVDTGGVLFALSDKLIVLAHVDEVDIGKIRIGMPARITLDSYPDAAIQGKVFNILYEGTNVSNVITYGVKVEPQNVPAFFRSQMTANINFIVDRKENVVLIPAAAVTDKAGEKQVLVPAPDGKPIARPVKTGLESGEDVEIVSGLNAGDTVIISHKRYTTQQAASSSPLIMSGPRQQQNSGSGTRQGATRSNR